MVFQFNPYCFLRLLFVNELWKFLILVLWFIKLNDGYEILKTSWDWGINLCLMGIWILKIAL